MARVSLLGVALVVGLALVGVALPGAGAVTPPTAAVCKPATIRMEYFSGLGTKLGEYDARFSRLVRTHPDDPYAFKCLWVAGGPTDEAFVVFVEVVPSGAPGRIPSGNCSGTRRDSYPFFHSRTRYLSVSGGERKEAQRALAGNETILRGVLAAAEAAGVGAPCPGTAPIPTPKPKPKPTPASPALPSSGELFIDYRMPERYGRPGARGITESHDTASEIRPSGWRVSFTVKRKDGKPCAGSLRPTVPGATSSGSAGVPCAFHAVYPREGTYTVTVTLRDGSTTRTGRRTFVVQDWLIVGLGDSNGSGEGSPDVPSPPLPARDPPVWQAPQCDRSAYSFEAQAARSIENRDPRTSVTFVHLACSGASIQEGLLGAYAGIVPSAGEMLSPQLLDMRRLAGGREVDAVLISIGVNDLGFAKLVEHCILYPSCQDRGFPNPLTSSETLDAVMQQRILALPGLYDRLARSLEALGIPARNVYLSEYFDSTRDGSGAFCDPLIRVDATRLRPFTALIPHPFLRKVARAATSVVLDFDRDEARWANEKVLTRLNKQVRNAASRHGWRLVSGVAQRFRTHGYCAGADSWIIGLFESLERQHDHNGTLHANPKGNAETAKLALPVLRRELYPGGRTRQPTR